MNICVKFDYYSADGQINYTALWALFPSMHIFKIINRVVLYSGVNKKDQRSLTKDLSVSQTHELYHNPELYWEIQLLEQVSRSILLLKN